MIRPITILMLVGIAAPFSYAAEKNSGKALYEKHCLSCHAEEVMTRPNHRVKDLKQLHNQVRRCELSLGLRWFESDIDQVTDYLNLNFYKFK